MTELDMNLHRSKKLKKMVMHLLTTAMALPWVEDLQSASTG